MKRKRNRLQRAVAEAVELGINGINDGDHSPIALLKEPSGHLNAIKFETTSGTIDENLVSNARSVIAASDSSDLYALAYDGYWTFDGVKTDALIIEAGRRGDHKAFRFTQRYKASSRGAKAVADGETAFLGCVATIWTQPASDAGTAGDSNSGPDNTPDYVLERIRRVPPPRLSIVAGSSPVIAFGDFARARVATLGLNPSKREFLDCKGAELTGANRRFETPRSLGCLDLSQASNLAMQTLLERCTRYFDLNPYTQWFDKLDCLLRHLDASYYDGTACHLDLVQWATDPTWSKLEKPMRRELVDQDLPLLKQQLAASGIRLLLLNGKRVIRESGEWLNLKPHGKTKVGRVTFHAGRSPEGVLAIGWNINIQSSYGVSKKEIDSIGKAVAKLARKLA
jgi:hypothetical protein